MKYSQVFWDFDGTLFNSYPIVAKDFKQALDNFKIPLPDESELLRLIKTTLGEAALSFTDGNKKLADDILSEYKRIALKRNPADIPLYNGAYEVLKSVKDNGGQNYLFTHRDKSAVSALASKNALEFFKDVITNEMGFARKPSPDAINFLIDKYGLNKNKCCMVGDRPIDLGSAKNAEIASVLFDPENYYPDFPCDCRFASFSRMQRALFDSAM